MLEVFTSHDSFYNSADPAGNRKDAAMVTVHLTRNGEHMLKACNLNAHLQPMVTVCFCYGNSHCLSWQSDWMNFSFCRIFIYMYSMKIVPQHTMPVG